MFDFESVIKHDQFICLTENGNEIRATTNSNLVVPKTIRIVKVPQPRD